jgi:uncharacterized protein with PIN domain
VTPSPPFLVDAMCGTLATYLRFCGYDAAYALDRGVEADDEVLALAEAEDRTLVTRDAALAERAGDRGLLLTSRDVADQLTELAEAGLDLSVADRPSRCGDCNGPLEPVPADASTPAYAPDPETTPQWRCRRCGRHFWKGSHYERVAETLSER